MYAKALGDLHETYFVAVHLFRYFYTAIIYLYSGYSERINNYLFVIYAE